MLFDENVVAGKNNFPVRCQAKSKMGIMDWGGFKPLLCCLKRMSYSRKESDNRSNVGLDIPPYGRRKPDSDCKDKQINL